MANVNGKNAVTEAVMIATAKKFGADFANGVDAWPMMFQSFVSWGQDGAINSAVEDKAKGTPDKVKARVADFIEAAGKTTLAVSTVANKETEMRAAVKLGEHCAAVKVDGVKLVVNTREALYANRNPGKGKKPVPTMQTLNAFAHVARRFVEKKLTKLQTADELRPLVKAPGKGPAPKALEVWQAEARTLGVLTGLVSEKLKASEKAIAKKDVDENSVKVAAAVIAYVNKMVDAAKANGKKAAK